MIKTNNQAINLFTLLKDVYGVKKTFWSKKVSTKIISYKDIIENEKMLRGVTIIFKDSYTSSKKLLEILLNKEPKTNKEYYEKLYANSVPAESIECSSVLGIENSYLECEVSNPVKNLNINNSCSYIIHSEANDIKSYFFITACLEALASNTGLTNLNQGMLDNLYENIFRIMKSNCIVNEYYNKELLLENVQKDFDTVEYLKDLGSYLLTQKENTQSLNAVIQRQMHNALKSFLKDVKNKKNAKDLILVLEKKLPVSLSIGYENIKIFDDSHKRWSYFLRYLFMPIVTDLSNSFDDIDYKTKKSFADKFSVFIEKQEEKMDYKPKTQFFYAMLLISGILLTSPISYPTIVGVGKYNRYKQKKHNKKMVSLFNKSLPDLRDMFFLSFVDYSNYFSEDNQNKIVLSLDKLKGSPFYTDSQLQLIDKVDIFSQKIQIKNAIDNSSSEFKRKSINKL